MRAGRFERVRVCVLFVGGWEWGVGGQLSDFPEIRVFNVDPHYPGYVQVDFKMATSRNFFSIFFFGDT